MSRSGRPRSTNSAQDEEIIERINSNPFLTATQIARDYNVSRPTISNRFRKNNIRCYVSASQTALTEDQRIHRYAFFESLLENHDQDWFNRIIFSDEKTFQSDCERQIKVYRPQNKRYDPKYISTSRLSGRISASYWGAISIEGPATNLIRIDGHFNKTKYMNVLKENLVPVMHAFNNNRIFMQDCSPIHTANVVMEFLSQQDFELLDWCPHSPDCNPIENVWSYITRDWPKLPHRTPQALDSVIQERWENLRNEPEYFRNLYKSFPKRCREICEHNGNWCHY